MEKQKVKIGGVVMDAQTGDPLVGVVVKSLNNPVNSSKSNRKGRFKLNVVPNGRKPALEFSLKGYRASERVLNGGQDPKKQQDMEIKLLKDTNKNFDDYELITKALDGDQLAYGDLLNRYRDSVNFVILKMVNNRDDAEDLTIEAFGKAFNNLEKYSPDYAFSTWLFRIAINNSIDFIRKKRLATLSIDEPIGNDDGDSFSRNIHANSLDPEETFIKSQRALLMRSVTDKLNEKYRRLIQLRYFDEYTYDEIAKEMQIPLGTVKAQLFRAKELLYNILKYTKEKI